MSNTLLLNSDFNPISVLPLSIISWQHAVKLYFLGRVSILETYPDKLIHSEHLTIEMPSVCVTKEYFNFKKSVKFSRTNVYLRDLYQCQYCSDTFSSGELTLDHVIPRANGGKTNFINTVTACKSSNFSKGTKLWKPLRVPFKPDYYSLLSQWKNRPVRVSNPGWNKYLGLEEIAVNA
jgi:5-methylcytosine-specific restriction endonuclease McrA